MAHPVCGRLGDAIADAATELDIRFARGGTYLVMEGPQFSTLAESDLYRSWGCDVIGMTNMPEAKLAREAEMCYATVAMVTDYDCWHPDHDDVTVDAIIRVLMDNADKGRALVKQLTPKLAGAPRSLSSRLPHRLGHGDHHRAGSPRSGDGGQARRRGGPGSGAMIQQGRARP